MAWTTLLTDPELEVHEAVLPPEVGRVQVILTWVKNTCAGLCCSSLPVLPHCYAVWTEPKSGNVLYLGKIGEHQLFVSDGVYAFRSVAEAKGAVDQFYFWAWPLRALADEAETLCGVMAEP